MSTSIFTGVEATIPKLQEYEAISDSVFSWNQKYLVLVFLNGLSSRLGTTHATVGEIRKILRKGPAVVHVPNALFLDWPIV